MGAAEKTVIVIAGPTAVGKTAVAISLAQKLGTEILSADSRQCYKGMTLGTAKPSAAELATVTHYFIDNLDIDTHFTAADYETFGLSTLSRTFEKHDYAVVCGGTGLYIQALCSGLDEMPAVDKTVVEETEFLYEKFGIGWLQHAVASEDPEFYAAGEIHNPARLLRALSFMRATGKSITAFRTGTGKERPFRIVKVALELPRELLYERINARVDQMMADGLEAEVRGLLPYRHLKNLNTVGYTELYDHFDGNSSLPATIEKIKQHTRNYAKRQLTWFRKDKEYNWLNAADPNIIEKILLLL
ncbi:MAG: tRNA (adenosine(37)-N6)-dimethylallyltransferase MiaA [Taibaiella sp.]|nr:tRNA (adenosine(37)-N6)-dimethylallyltransferase MiaA [Taibaiella sp.]